jgi:inorganic triphosphatase YgiF
MDSRISVEQEREIKLVFRCQRDFPDRGSFEHSLKRSLARCTANIQITRLSTGRIVSEYWDTDTGTLAAAGLSLRVRTDRMSQRTTVKAVPEGEGFSGEMLRHREEVHIPGSTVEGASPDPAMFRNTPVGSR